MPRSDGAFEIDSRHKMHWRSLIIGASVPIVISIAAMWHYRAFILQYAVSSWVVSDPIGAADAAVVLGGNSRDRPPVAAELFRNGLVKEILVDTDDDKKALIGLNVPPQAIEYFGKGLANTHEEACALAHWAHRKQSAKLIIPVEPLSSRRLSWIVTRELIRSGTDVAIDPLPDPAIEDWWRSAAERAEFQSEITKYLYYRARYQFSRCGS